MSRRAVALTWSLIITASVGAGWPTPEALDEQRLRQAGVRLDAAELLAYLQPAVAPPERLAHLLKALDDDDYDTRARAGQELVRLGQPARAALEPLTRSPAAEVRRLAGQLLDEIDTRLASPTTLSALRTLCRLRHPKAVALVLDYLPHVDVLTRQSLSEALLRADPDDESLRAAVGDPSATRRAVVGLMLARHGKLEHALPLLRDADATVRLRTAQGLLGRGDNRGLEPLVDLLAAPLDHAWQAEELLRWAADASAPAPLLGKGDAKSRKESQDAWRTWLTAPGRTIDWAARKRSPQRPALFLICRGEKVELIGSDGTIRFTYENTASGSISDAHLMAEGRLLVFDDNDAEARLIDTAGKVAWKWKAPAGEIAQTLQLLPSEGRIVAVTDEQIHELTSAGKHLGSMRTGELFFSDACRLDSGRYAAIADEGFYMIDRAGRILSKIAVPGLKEDQGMDGGKLLPMGDGMFAMTAPNLDRAIVYDAAGVAYDGPIAGKPRSIVGLSRHRDGTWVVAQIQGPGLFRLAELDGSSRVVREVPLVQRPTRVRLVLEDLRAGLDDAPAGFNVDSAENRIAALQSGSIEVRRRAATLLGQLKDDAPRVIGPLVAAMDSDDATLRANASKSLAALGSVALPALLQSLRQGPERVRIHAARGLGQLRVAAVPAVPALIDTLTDPASDASHRAAVCEALGLIGFGASAACPHLRTAIDASEVEVRQAAIVALGLVGQGEEENVKALVTALEDKLPGVAIAAATGLGRYTNRARVAVPNLVRCLTPPVGESKLPSGAFDLRRAALTALGEIGLDPAQDNEKTIQTLTEIARNSKEELDLRQLTLRALAKFGPASRPALPAIREMLLVAEKPPMSNQLHTEAMRVLTALKHHGGIQVLVDVARIAPENTRYSAITQLGNLGAEAHAAVGPLTEMAVNEKVARIRTAIQRTLKRIPMPPIA